MLATQARILLLKRFDFILNVKLPQTSENSKSLFLKIEEYKVSTTIALHNTTILITWSAIETEQARHGVDIYRSISQLHLIIYN